MFFLDLWTLLNGSSCGLLLNLGILLYGMSYLRCLRSVRCIMVSKRLCASVIVVASKWLIVEVLGRLLNFKLL